MNVIGSFFFVTVCSCFDQGGWQLLWTGLE